jgi:hypothetical protein
LLVILALAGLMAPIEVSAPGGSGQSEPQLMVTINEVCTVTFDFDYSGVTYHDNLTTTLQERHVYRITRYDNGEYSVIAVLEVSATATLPPDLWRGRVISEPVKLKILPTPTRPSVAEQDVNCFSG